MNDASESHHAKDLVFLELDPYWELKCRISQPLYHFCLPRRLCCDLSLFVCWTYT